ncbi:MAG: orotate phosphoribosyltransferase [Bdellovibrionales bacterium]|nr:orotate phosphoribosyltransferase [Bdellovibrionales bacterium]
MSKILKNLTTSAMGLMGAGAGNERSRLLRVIREKSYREGDFTLASGQKSSFYVDVKTSTLHPEGAYLVGRLMVEAVQKAGWNVQAVGGLTLGADPIATSVSLAAHAKSIHWPAFIVRKESKGHGTGKYIEGIENIPEKGRVLILEDVTTTGGSAITAIERVKEAGFQIAGVATVVDRQQGAAEKFKEAGVPFLALVTLEEVRAVKL